MIFSQPPEMTTAVTDALFGILSFFLAYRLGAVKKTLRVRIWRLVLCGIGASAVFGVPAHALYAIAGMNPSDLPAQTVYWACLGLFLFFMAAMLGTAVLFDIFGEKRLKLSAAVMGISGAIFFAIYFAAAVTGAVAGYFVIFILYSGLVMLTALAAYPVLYFKRKDSGYLFMSAAVLTSVAANILQSMRGITFTAVWEFDYNIYHFMMMAAVVLFYRGIRKAA